AVPHDDRRGRPVHRPRDRQGPRARVPRQVQGPRPAGDPRRHAGRLQEVYNPAKHRFRVTGPDFTLALPPSRPIAGTVRDHATKKPIAGVRVSYQFVAEAAFLRRWHAVETTTDADGRYTLVGAPPGKDTVVLF